MTLGAFACVLAMRRRDGMVEEIDELAGLAQTNLGMATLLAILLFSLAGIPPLAGFFAKFYVFMAAVKEGMWALAVLGVLASVVGAYYYVRIVKVMFFDEPKERFASIPAEGRRRHGGGGAVHAAVRGLAGAAGRGGGQGGQEPVLTISVRRNRGFVRQSVRSIVLSSVGSTNAEAFERARAGEAGPLWIMAHRQTAGRGRSGRQWMSEPGNLYASLLMRLACPPAAVPQLSLLAGVAVVDAIRAAAEGDVAGLRLKWPNDILLGGAKCAGILAESVSGGPGDLTAVIGVGLNLAWHPADLGRAATHLMEHGVAVEPQVMLGSVAEAMQHWIDVWNLGAGFARVRLAWLERAGPAGEACSVDTGAERIAGSFLGLDEGGSLRMRDADGRERTLTYGDVTLAPQAEGRR